MRHCAVVYTDRADTVKTAGGAETAATKASSAREHLWTRFFAAFGGDPDVQVFKTKAHASAGDVEAGRSTAWERRGNDHADRLAKLGAQAHGLTRTHIAEAEVLGSIAFQAARWAGEVRVLAQQALESGHHVERRPRRRQPLIALETRGPKRQKAQPGENPGQGSQWRRRSEDATRPEDDDLGGHKVAFATVQGGGGEPLGPIAFCQACGAYFWRRVGSLSRPCGGARPYGQSALLLKGRFPATGGRYRTWTVAAVKQARPSQRAELQHQLDSCRLSSGPCEPARRRLGAKTGPAAAALAATMGRRALLRRYGLTELTLASLVAEAATARRATRSATAARAERAWP